METINNLKNKKLVRTSPKIPQKNIFKILFTVITVLFFIVVFFIFVYSRISSTKPEVEIPKKISEVIVTPSSRTLTPRPTYIPKKEPTSLFSSSTYTDGWKTYADSTYKYLIKYPNDWVLKYDQEDKFIIIKNPNSKEVIRIFCYPNFDKYVEDDLFFTINNIHPKNSLDYISILGFGSEIRINGNIVYLVTQEGSGHMDKFIFENKDFSVCNLDGEWNSWLNNFTETQKQVLSSFKFN